MSKTSWSPVAKWYGGIVGVDGHYFHQHVIFPALKQLLTPQPGSIVLDVGCGQGIYARTIPPPVKYVGIDISRDLIIAAKKIDTNPAHQYFVADATQSLPVSETSFDHAVSILALQNMANADSVISHVARALKVGGSFTCVLNHPAFRIPRQSSWGQDPATKIEYRQVNRYLSQLEIPINAHPGDQRSPVTWSYHQPISYYFTALKRAGLVTTDLLELTSDKKSVGKAARAENRARREFPLFLVIQAVKINI
ncbi:MAG: hypothetical protein UX62_C0018G0003 [Microgenomates group bacterium GW2011_GWA2_46_7]|nr:MAG: hypothetical protein UX64_C0031G0006 [Microgenomates group bacterium GW2011_GWC2_46_7]KKU46129.1 MAG: hypothetical protein UX62_C0018G0003 [Microgenomates group bacterium GW2011_GWA2_46_7]